MDQPLARPPKSDEDTPAPVVLPPDTEIPDIPDPDAEDDLQVHDTKKNEGLKSIITTVAILVLAPLIAFLLTAFIFQSYQVDGKSMETTLYNADRLIVLKLPRSWSKITHHPYIPNRGDVIIFNKNELSQFDGPGQKKQLVKRVIGLPGDRVVLKDSVLTVYNSEHPEGFNPDKTLPYGKNIPITLGAVDLTVGPSEVFVLGDNRGNSLDSRIFGPVSHQDIVGKLIMRIFPFNKAKLF